MKQISNLISESKAVSLLTAVFIFDSATNQAKRHKVPTVLLHQSSLE
ncbi:MAG: hypothetical protein ACI9XO_004940 [Paraglaciecola sp.]|jgi:hypothetical protein